MWPIGVIELSWGAFNMTFDAVFEGGVFRPLQPIDLPEGTIVELEIIAVYSEDGTPRPLPATFSNGETSEPSSTS